MLKLNNIILVAISSNRITETEKAIRHCLSLCEFKDVIFFTDNNSCDYYYEIEKISSIKDYDKFIIKKLPYLLSGKADYYLTIHWDGFIVNTDAWNNDFLLYDYIGAPWPWYKNMCGNGGFCLKSQKFLDTQIKLIDELSINYPDDFELCIRSRTKFLDMQCNYAPSNIAYQFSNEFTEYELYKSFGFHDFKYNPQFKYIIEK